MEVLRKLIKAKQFSWLRSASSAILIPFLLLTSWSSPNQSAPSKEYQLKAVFLFNFTQFTTWPPHAFPEPETPVIIGVLGNNPFGNYLSQTVKGETINGHPLVIRYYKKVEDIDACHILFINLPKGIGTKEVLSNLKNKNTLTVGDAPDFIGQGGIIQFVTSDHKIRMKINMEATREADLTFSAKLLRLADIVN